MEHKGLLLEEFERW